MKRNEREIQQKYSNETKRFLDQNNTKVCRSGCVDFSVLSLYARVCSENVFSQWFCTFSLVLFEKLLRKPQLTARHVQVIFLSQRHFFSCSLLYFMLAFVPKQNRKKSSALILFRRCARLSLVFPKPFSSFIFFFPLIHSSPSIFSAISD